MVCRSIDVIMGRLPKEQMNCTGIERTSSAAAEPGAPVDRLCPFLPW